MESYHAHQLILPTDKRNPCFTLYATEDQQSIRVFYGLELMEVVPDDPDDMAFKMMVGRLYNAGVMVTTLEDVFKSDRKTIRSWGLAILSRDPDILHRVMLGRWVNRKRTPAIDKYVALRRAELLAEGCPNYRVTLIREIESFFDVKLSGETLRQITGETKGSPAAYDVSFIDAAHLVPFSVAPNDHPTNGLALCKNHHWAMDRNLIAPAPDHHWHVARVLDPRRSTGEAELLGLGGKKLLLPQDQAFHPDSDGLKWRREQLIA